jgi:hypothetical protein
MSSLHQELLKRVPNGHAARDRVSLRAKQKRDMELRAAKQAKETNKGMAGQGLSIKGLVASATLYVYFLYFFRTIHLFIHPFAEGPLYYQCCGPS